MVWNRFLKSHWLTVMLQASPERKEEYDATRGWRGKGFISRDETREWDSSDQKTLLPSCGQDEEQEVMKQRPGRPVADSDGDFVIPLTKSITLLKQKTIRRSMSKSCI
ncbi:hypothetical protein ROHU_021671 [Labeo rohita]|uniref:Uncharacterized protein n=1 Tax=Labeo rohita TaxID=84645 RepID=A0A498N012_LABRO|nr:hypothetical protein ROHU_021671 [Labeo rohita]